MTKLSSDSICHLSRPSHVIDPEYSPFLDWNPYPPVTIDSVAPVFLSLVSMVRDGYQFDEELLRQCSNFISSIIRHFGPVLNFEDLLEAIGQDSPNPAAVFVDSVTVLLSSSYPSIIRNALSFLSESLDHCFPMLRRALISNGLIHRILSTHRLRDLSVVTDRLILKEIIKVFEYNLRPTYSTDLFRTHSNTSDTDPESVRDVVLNEVLILIEPSLVQISRNRHLLSWNKEFKDTLRLLLKIFKDCGFHQPTLDFICSSRIPMVFQSLLSKVEDDHTHQGSLWIITDNINKWKHGGTETMHRGRILLRKLEQEGFHEGLEQVLLHHKSSPDGHFVRFDSFDIMNSLGMNSSQPR